MIYDGSNIEMRYVKKLAVSGGQVRRPQFVIDSYNDLFFTCDMWNGTKHYGVALFKIAMSQVETLLLTQHGYSRRLLHLVLLLSQLHMLVSLLMSLVTLILLHMSYMKIITNKQSLITSNTMERLLKSQMSFLVLGIVELHQQITV